MQQLYGHTCNVVELAGKDKWYSLPKFIDIPGLIEKALTRIFDKPRADVDPDLMEITYAALDNAIDTGFGAIRYGEPNFEFAEQLRGSAALFSARKTYAQSRDLAQLAIKENGHQRTWKEFRELAAPIVKDYNMTWLETEFNTAILAARGAKNWKKYEENIHLFPNLEYTPSRAATPREEHKPFYHLVLPVMDDFWIRNYPPSAWRCLCGAKQSRKPVSTNIPEGVKVSPGLDNNPGITGKLFSETHPYHQGLTGNEKDETAQKAKDHVAKRSKGSSK